MVALTETKKKGNGRAKICVSMLLRKGLMEIIKDRENISENILKINFSIC